MVMIKSISQDLGNEYLVNICESTLENIMQIMC
jgi:hypothetical protein